MKFTLTSFIVFFLAISIHAYGVAKEVRAEREKTCTEPGIYHCECKYGSLVSLTIFTS
jgi:hypothetical protein